MLPRVFREAMNYRSAASMLKERKQEINAVQKFPMVTTMPKTGLDKQCKSSLPLEYISGAVKFIKLQRKVLFPGKCAFFSFLCLQGKMIMPLAQTPALAHQVPVQDTTDGGPVSEV